jgi:hypothetical protein
MPVATPRQDFYIYQNDHGIYVAPGSARAWAWAEEFLPTDRSVYGPRLLVDKEIWPAIKLALKANKFKVRLVNI